jgi:hypothetical protein
MVKLNMAADVVPELVTEALEPAAPVVVEPTATVAEAPGFIHAAGVDQVGVVEFVELTKAILT